MPISNPLIKVLKPHKKVKKVTNQMMMKPHKKVMKSVMRVQMRLKSQNKFKGQEMEIEKGVWILTLSNINAQVSFLFFC